MKRTITIILLTIGLVMPAFAQSSVQELQSKVAKYEQIVKSDVEAVKKAEEKCKKAQNNVQKEEFNKEWKTAVNRQNEDQKILDQARKDLEQAEKAKPNAKVGAEVNAKANAESNPRELQTNQVGQELDQEINSTTEAQEQPVADSKASRKPKVDKTDDADSGTPWWMQLLGMLAIAGVCSGGVFAVMNNKLKAAERYLKARIKKNEQEYNLRLSTLVEKTDRIEASLGNMRTDFAGVKSRMTTATQPQSKTQPMPQQPKPAQRTTVFFLSMPGVDGTWRDASAVKNPSQSLYQMISEDGVNGRFIVLNEPIAVQMITMQVTKYLNPVCRMTNTMSQVSGIVTDEPGICIKENGVWRVTRKAVAHYV